jgi:O-antigen/teichoic acid export membrane protein
MTNQTPVATGTTRITVQAWVSQGAWAIVDQGLFASSNFILNILLARWLAPDEYGAFALAFSVFLLLATSHTALLSEPMLVFGPGRFSDRFERYLESIMFDHWKLTALFGVLLLLVGVGVWVAGQKLVGVAVIALALACPFILLQWLMRRACYVRGVPRWAALAGAGYAVLVILGASLLARWGLLSAPVAFGLMGLASFATALWLAARLEVRVAPATKGDSFTAPRAAHWAYGRWALGAAALTWIPLNAYFVLLPIWGGLAAAGAFRALFNLMVPITNLNTALGPVLLPALVAVRGTSAFPRLTRRAAFGLLGCGVLSWVLLALFGQPLMSWLYAGQYDAFALALPWLGAASVTLCLTTIAEGALRALERPDRVFWSNACSGAVAIATGVLMVPNLGVLGACLGLVVSSLTAAVLMSWHLWIRMASEVRQKGAQKAD